MNDFYHSTQTIAPIFGWNKNQQLLSPQQNEYWCQLVPCYTALKFFILLFPIFTHLQGQNCPSPYPAKHLINPKELFAFQSLNKSFSKDFMNVRWTQITNIYICNKVEQIHHANTATCLQSIQNFHHCYKVLSTEHLKHPFHGVRELASLFG